MRRNKRFPETGTPGKGREKPRNLDRLILRMAETLAGTGRGRFPGIAVSGNVSWQQPAALLFSLTDSDKNHCKGMIGADAHYQSAIWVDRDGVHELSLRENSGINNTDFPLTY